MYRIHSHANQQAKQQTLSTKINPHIYNTRTAYTTFTHTNSAHTQTIRASMHTATQFEKCSNHQFEYKTYERSLFLSYETYKYDTHVACVSLKPMRMLSRAYTKPPLFLSLQHASWCWNTKHRARAHTHASIRVSIKIWC